MRTAAREAHLRLCWPVGALSPPSKLPLPLTRSVDTPWTDHPRPLHIAWAPQGVENVYTQHTPPLVGLLEKAVKARLPDADYPRADKARLPAEQKVRRRARGAGRAPGCLVAALPREGGG